MHYADKRPAKAGDVIMYPSDDKGSLVIGVLVSARTGSTTCNGQMRPLLRRVVSDAGVTSFDSWQPPYEQCITLSECELLVRGDGSDDLKVKGAPGEE